MTDLRILAKQAPISVLSIGINMKCTEVVTKSILYFEDGEYLIKNGGLVMVCNNIEDMMLDTKENRNILKSKCDPKTK